MPGPGGSGAVYAAVHLPSGAEVAVKTLLPGLPQVGEIIARFNFVLAPSAQYLAEAEGDHYEETFSVSPDGEAHLQHPMMALARWRP